MNFPSQLDFVNNESKELEHLKLEMKQHNIEVMDGSTFPENDPLWKPNLDQFKEISCQATVMEYCSASQQITEIVKTTQRNEVL